MDIKIFIIILIIVLVFVWIYFQKEKFENIKTNNPNNSNNSNDSNDKESGKIFNYFYGLFMNPYDEPLTKFYSNDKLQ